jgi:hypothetical protein
MQGGKTMSNIQGCPYKDKDCPKVDDVAQLLDKVASTLSTLTRIVYIMCGIFVAEIGVVIW